MADCRSGLIDAVIVSKHDRFGRSFRHTVTLIGELGDIGVEFVSILRSAGRVTLSAWFSGRPLLRLVGAKGNFQQAEDLAL